MTKQSTILFYQDKIDQALTFIHNNIEKSLSFEDVACHVNVSSYHFHRIFRAHVGETVAKTQKRLRLQQAAANLLRSNTPIADIADQALFSSQSTFTRAFHLLYGVTPSQYRLQNGGGFLKSQNEFSEIQKSFEIDIVEMDDITLSTLSHQGDYLKIASQFDRLLSVVNGNAFSESVQVWALYYDDPECEDVSALRSKAGITYPKALIPFDDVQETIIPKGKFAKLIYQGPYNELDKPYQWLYKEWLPSSGYKVLDFPVCEQYVSNPYKVDPKDLITEIYLPLES